MKPFMLFLVIFFALPLTVLTIFFREYLFQYKRTIFWSLVFVYTLGWFWDVLSYKTGVWRYDAAPTLGVWLGGLPIEEFLGFFVLGTLLMVFTILIVHKKVK